MGTGGAPRREAKQPPTDARRLADEIRRFAREHPQYVSGASQRYAVIREWGVQRSAAQAEADRVAAELHVARPVSIQWGATGRFVTITAAYWSAADNTLLINSAWWERSEGFMRLDAIAHEVFHAHQVNVIRAAKAGRVAASDPLYARVIRWNRTVEDLFDPTLEDPAAKFANFRRYLTHPFEGDAYTFGHEYLERRFRELAKTAE